MPIEQQDNANGAVVICVHTVKISPSPHYLFIVIVDIFGIGAGFGPMDLSCKRLNSTAGEKRYEFGRNMRLAALLRHGDRLFVLD